MKRLIISAILLILIIAGYTYTVKAADITPTSGVYEYTYIESVAGDNGDLPILNVTKDSVIIGYMDENERVPIIRERVTIKTTRELSVSELEAVDIEMSAKGLQRDGGTTIIDKIKELGLSNGE